MMEILSFFRCHAFKPEMPPRLPSATRFEVPKEGTHKYVAILPDGKRVRFGHREYEQYKDSVPASMGGGKWTAKNHGDADRRRNFRSRAEGQTCSDGRRCIDVHHSPAWFSYHFLW